MTFDVAIVGGGIVGLATAHALTETHGAKVLVLEKEAALAGHQTGHNSGVIHTGVYYKPGSLKAKLAVSGSKRMVEFCRSNGIRHDICGKVIVATRQSELAGLDTLFARGIENGVRVARLDADG